MIIWPFFIPLAAPLRCDFAMTVGKPGDVSPVRYHGLAT